MLVRSVGAALALAAPALAAFDLPATCNFTALPKRCSDANGGSVCTGSYTVAPVEFLYSCLKEIPLNTVLKNDALDITYGIADQLYSFTDALRNPGAFAGLAKLPNGKTGYYYNKTIDLRAEINALRTKSHANQFDFEYDLGYLFGQLRDAHTLYRTPFAGLGFWRPVSFGSALDQDGKQIAYIASVAEGAAQAAMNFFPNVTATVSDLKFAVGKPIKTINGVDAFEYVYNLAKEQCIVRSDAVCLSYFIGTTYFNAVSRRIPEKGTEVFVFADNTNLTVNLVGVIPPTAGNVWLNVTNVTQATSAILSPTDWTNYTTALERITRIPGIALPADLERQLAAIKAVSSVRSGMSENVPAGPGMVSEDPFDVEPKQIDPRAFFEASQKLGSFGASDVNNSTVVPNLVPLQNIDNTLLYFRGSSAKLPFNVLKLTSFSILPTPEFRDALNFIAEDGMRNNVDTLLVDFTGNGGGYVVTQALIVQFLSAVYQDELALCEPYDYRVTGYFAAQGAILNKTLAAVPAVNSTAPVLTEVVKPTLESLRVNSELFTNITAAMIASGESDSDLTRFAQLATNISDAVHALPLDGSNSTAEILISLRDRLALGLASLSKTATSYGLVDAETNARTLKPFDPEFEFLQNPVAKKFGGVDGNYTQQVTIACPPPNIKPAYYYKKIYVLTDGSCGSACSNAITKLYSDGKVKVISVGGALRDPADIGSFNGGNVLEYANAVTSLTRSRLATLAGAARDGSAPYIARPFATRAVARFNWRMGYFRGLGQEANLPRELYNLPADFRIPVWGFGYGKWPTVDPVQLYGLYASASQVMFAAPPSNNTETPAAPGPVTPTFSDAAFYGVVGAAGALALVAIVLTIVLVRRRRTGYVNIE